ncbi:hypothetical protein DVH26_04620 [Paenibacillus sp. H1-7]|uniref:hypothetical protein n=1 Tax=Paenibacillus sp. H1-7 TaxID=2282849 RepID=UPI001EF91D40|nr:hypothetical protein [Paenibacillus sp. H1-7]ULL13790.1 hypothetical protein DVH26_04620 [Paenibacillus sp. H1-7]
MNTFIDYLDQFNVLSPNHAKIYDEYTQKSDTYLFSIPTRVEQYLADVFVKQPRSIIMTGNAGDGKTRLCRSLYEMLTNKQLEGWPKEGIIDVTYEGGTVRIVKDLSELTESVIYTELLRLQSSVANAHADRVYYLIAANEGKLTKFLSQYPELKPLADAVGARFIDHLNNNDRLHLVNLQDVTSSIYADRIFEEWNQEKYWGACDECPAQKKCIISFNHRKMVQPGVRDKLIEQYRLLDCLGIHVTMREILIHASYTITGGLTCSTVLQADYSAIEQQAERAYYNNFYGVQMPDVSTGEMGAVRYLTRLDPGQLSISSIDDFLLNGDISGDPAIVEQHSNLFEEDIDLLFGYFRKRIEQYRTLDPEQDHAQLFDQMPRFRRKFFFECGEQGNEMRQSQLPYNYYYRFAECLMKPQVHAIIRRDLMHGLNQAFAKKLIIRPNAPVLYAVNENLLIHGVYLGPAVKLAVESQRDDIDHMPSRLILSVQNSIKLEVRLPVFEYLLRLSGGGLFMTLRQEVEILLSTFKNDLINNSELDEFALSVLALDADKGVYDMHNINIEI